MSDILPFGKYKGKQVSVLSDDTKYAEWLLINTNIKSKNPKIYSYVSKLLKIDNTLYNKIITYLEDNIIKININDEIFSNIKILYNMHINKLIEQVNDNYNKGVDVSLVTPPHYYTQKLEHLNISKDHFKKFFKKYKIVNPFKICETIRNFGGHKNKFTMGYKIAQQRSQLQENYWKELLKAAYHSNVIYHPPIENGCVYDFINRNKEIIYEVKLKPQDFVYDQFIKYKKQRPTYNIKYLFGHNAIWDTEYNMLYVQCDLPSEDFCIFIHDLKFYKEGIKSCSLSTFDIEIEEVDDISGYL